MSASPRQFRDELLAITPQLRAYARALCRAADKADDLVQDTLLRAWEKQNTLRDANLLKPWLLTIMRNLFRQQQRQMRLMVEDIDGTISGSVFVSGDQEAAAELHDVTRALSAIPAEQCEAIVLIVINELSYDQAAALAGCATGTMKSRVNRARQNLVVQLNLLNTNPLYRTSQIRSYTEKVPLQLEHVAACELVTGAQWGSRLGSLVQA